MTISREDSADRIRAGSVKGILETSVKALLVAALILTGGLICLFNFFACPGFDDVIRLERQASYGVVASVADEYKTQTGRWTGVGLMYWICSQLDVWRWYPLLLITISAVSILCIRRLVQALTERRLADRHVWLITAMVFILFWTSMRRPADGLYHLTFAIENVLSVSLAVFLVAHLIELRSGGSRRRNFLQLAFLGVASILTVGLHELYGSILVMALTVGTVQAYRLGTANRRAWRTATLCAIIGLVVVVAAPGNWERRARLEDQHRAEESRQTGWELTLRLAPRVAWSFIRDLRLLAGTLLLFTFLPLRRSRLQWPRQPGAHWFPMISIPLVGALFLGIAFPTVARGAAAVPRVENGLYLVFLTAWLGLTFWLASRFATSRWNRERVGSWVRIGAAALFVIALGIPLPTVGQSRHERATLVREIPARFSTQGIEALIQSNLTRGLEDVETRLFPYQRAVAEQWRYLRRQAGVMDREVVLDALPPTPFMVRSVEVTTDVDAPYNRALAGLFRVGGIRRANPGLGELSLGHDQLGILHLRAPSQAVTGLISPLARQIDARRFLLRPPPHHLGGFSLAEIVLTRISGDPYAVRATVGITGPSGPRDSVRTVVEAWSDSEGDARLLESYETTVSYKDGWVELGLGIPKSSESLGSIRILSRLESGSSGRPTVSFRVKRVELLTRRVE